MNEATMAIWADPSISEATLTELLVTEYYTYIVRLSASILRDLPEAEDVAQETFIIALTKIETLAPDSNMKAWLSTIAVNKCRDILRKRKTKQKFQAVLDSLRALAEPTEMPEKTAVQQETASKLWTAVDQLKDKHRLPILLRYVHNLSIREIADVLETKEGTIHSRLHYACKKLGAQLEASDVPHHLVEGVTR